MERTGSPGHASRSAQIERNDTRNSIHGPAYAQDRILRVAPLPQSRIFPEENRRVFGKCNNPNGHGHNYVLEVTVGGETDPETGMVLDLKELKEILEREIMERMDHRFLNYEVPELAGQIPTCENIAALIWKLLDPKISKGDLARVRLWESPDLYVDCYGNGRP